MPPTQSVPSILEIQLHQILPNPENPAGPVGPEEAQAMAETLREEGQKAEIRVRLLTDEEKQAFRQGSGQGNSEAEYMLIGGHVRLEGAKLAGLSSLRAIVVEKTNPDQEYKDAYLDNRKRDIGWWKDDLAIERMLKATNGKGQAKLAAQLGISQPKVSNAWRVTQALTPAARELVGQNYQPLIAKNKGFCVTESILLALAGLEDPAKVEQALRRVLDDQMNESQAKKLVAEMQFAGGSSQTAGKGETATPKAVEPQNTQRSQGTDKAITGVDTATAKETLSSPSTAQPAVPSISQSVLEAALGRGTGQHQAHKAFSNSLKTWTLNWVMRSWKGMNGFYQKIGFKNPLVPSVATVFLLLLFVNGLPLKIERFVDHIITSIRQSSVPVTNPSVQSNQPPAVPPKPAMDTPMSVTQNSLPPTGSAKAQTSKPAVDSPKDVQKGSVVEKKGTGAGIAQASTEGAGTVSAGSVAATPGPKKGEDPLKAVGEGVKDASDAVNTADEGAKAVDKAKQLLGL